MIFDNIMKLISVVFILFFTFSVGFSVGDYVESSVITWQHPIIIFVLFSFIWCLGYFSKGKDEIKDIAVDVS